MHNFSFSKDVYQQWQIANAQVQWRSLAAVKGKVPAGTIPQIPIYS